LFQRQLMAIIVLPALADEPFVPQQSHSTSFQVGKLFTSGPSSLDFRVLRHSQRLSSEVIVWLIDEMLIPASPHVSFNHLQSSHSSHIWMEDWSFIVKIEAFHVTSWIIVRCFWGHFVEDLLTVRKTLKCKQIWD
jgi:hypothetical protein